MVNNLIIIGPFIILFLCETSNSNVLNINEHYIINYTLNDSNCSLLMSNNVQPEIKCLILCQTIKCKSLTIDSDGCNLFYGRPDLIQYDSLPGLNKIIYVLGGKIKQINNYFINEFIFKTHIQAWDNVVCSVLHVAQHLGIV